MNWNWNLPGCCCQVTSPTNTVQEIEHTAGSRVLDEFEEPAVKQRMVVTFETRSGKLKHVSVTQRPLGFKYTKTVPLTVVEVGKGSHASDLGIKHGWKVKLVNNEDITGKTYDVSLTLAAEECMALSCDEIVWVLGQDAGDLFVALPFVSASVCLSLCLCGWRGGSCSDGSELVCAAFGCFEALLFPFPRSLFVSLSLSRSVKYSWILSCELLKLLQFFDLFSPFLARTSLTHTHHLIHDTQHRSLVPWLANIPDVQCHMPPVVCTDTPWHMHTLTFTFMCTYTYTHR